MTSRARNVRTWYEFKNDADDSKKTSLYLYDEIGSFGKTAADFARDLQTVPKENRVVLRIHSPGGSVLEGSAIFNTLRTHPGGVETQIDGLAASMASVIACAGETVRMAGNGLYMIHNVTSGALGDAEELRKQAEVMDKIQETIVATYAGKTGKSKKEIREMMDAETWMTAKEAKEHGFVDEITGPLKMAAQWDAGPLSSGKYHNIQGLTEALERRLTETAQSVSDQTAEQKRFFEWLRDFFGFSAAEAAKGEEKNKQIESLGAEISNLKINLTNREAQIIELQQAAAKAKETATETEEKFEERVSTEVVRRCAAAGLSTPIKRDPDVNTDNDLDAVREKIAHSTDPKERAILARQARELRQKKAA